MVTQKRVTRVVQKTEDVQEDAVQYFTTDDKKFWTEGKAVSHQRYLDAPGKLSSWPQAPGWFFVEDAEAFTTLLKIKNESYDSYDKMHTGYLKTPLELPCLVKFGTEYDSRYNCTNLTIDVIDKYDLGQMVALLPPHEEEDW